MNTFSQSFCRFVERSREYAGKPTGFLLAVGIVVCWAASGPVFHFGNTWQLLIKTGTTIVTFLMVFLIQKVRSANALLNFEDLDDDTLDEMRNRARKLPARANQATQPKSGITGAYFRDTDSALPDWMRTLPVAAAQAS